MGCGNSKPAAAPAERVAPPAETKQEPVLLEKAEGDAKPEKPKPDQVEAPERETVRVEIMSARGLRNADFVGKSEPYCVVEIAGKAESKVQTKAAEDPKEPQWNHAAEVAGFSTGDSLVFLVKDSDPLKDDVLGKVTLTEEQVKSGFIGELQLTECGEGIEAFLKLRVGEPSMLDEAKNTVQETVADAREKLEDVKEAVEEKLEDAKEVIEDKLEDALGKENVDSAKELLQDVGDKLEQVAEAVEVQIDDETKACSCTCMSQPNSS